MNDKIDELNIKIIGLGCRTNRLEIIKKILSEHPVAKHIVRKFGEKTVLSLLSLDCAKCERIPTICLDVCIKCNQDHHYYPSKGCSGLVCDKCSCFRCCVSRTPMKPILILGLFIDEEATKNNFYERLVDNEYPEIRNLPGEKKCINDMIILGDDIIKSYHNV